MFKELKKAEDDLGNARAGWVTRRDGAELLGKTAVQALEALNRYRKEQDVDVQRAVGKALSEASAALSGVKPSAAAKKPYTVKDLVADVEKPGERTVKREANGFEINVVLKNNRHQVVHVSPHRRKDGVELVRVFTFCGKPGNDSLAWALRANMKLAQGAIALCQHEGEEHLVLTNCYIASEVTPAEVKASVKELAYYADWIEQKLSGLDDF